jgi:hypothetical protein
MNVGSFNMVPANQTMFSNGLSGFQDSDYAPI